MRLIRFILWPIAAAFGVYIAIGSTLGAEQAPSTATVPRAQTPESSTERLAEADALIQKGRVLRRSGSSAEAEALLKRALEIRREILGHDDPLVAGALDDLASAYYNRGQYGEAEGLYRQSVAIAEKALGPRNLELANFLGDLGAALREEQKFAEAEETVRRSLSIRALLLPADDPAIAGSLNNLGRNYLKQGRYAAAAQAFGESVRIFQKAFGPDDQRVRQGDELLAIVQRGEAAPPPTKIEIRGTPIPVPLQLNSGGSVSALSMGPFISPEGWAGMILMYQTSIPLKNSAALRREVDEVWQRFIVNVVKSGYDKALIMPQAAASGHSAPPVSARFLFVSDKDGWHTAEPADRVKKGLDRKFVTEVMERLDWLVTHCDGFGAALYLARDWTVTVKNMEQDGEKTSVLDRNQFASAVQLLDKVAPDHTHQRKILAISIDQMHRSAKVESEETETSERDGAKIRSVGRSVDFLSFVDDHVQITKSFEDAKTSVDKPL